MLIQIIEDSAEQKCIEALEVIHNSSANRNLLQCRFSDIGIKPGPDDILPLVKGVLTDKNASLFFCKDGDVFVSWVGYPKATLKETRNNILAEYGESIPEHLSEVFFKYYDFHVHGEDVRIECRNKLKKIQEEQEEQKKEQVKNTGIDLAATALAGFDDQMLRALQGNLANRHSRKMIEILIVEDQLFSRKLLMGVLSQDYQCHVAENASKALVLYALHAPDIVFLDIELPDMDGHTLAALFRDADWDSYIVMVTGNHYAEDIEKAQKNKVKGFIVKPYNKQKIMDAIHKFYQLRKKGL